MINYPDFEVAEEILLRWNKLTNMVGFPCKLTNHLASSKTGGFQRKILNPEHLLEENLAGIGIFTRYLYFRCTKSYDHLSHLINLLKWSLVKFWALRDRQTPFTLPEKKPSGLKDSTGNFPTNSTHLALSQREFL